MSRNVAIDRDVKLSCGDTTFVRNAFDWCTADANAGHVDDVMYAALDYQTEQEYGEAKANVAPMNSIQLFVLVQTLATNKKARKAFKKLLRHARGRG